MKNLIILIICSCVFLSCNHLSKSIEETFKPKDTVAGQHDQATASTTTETHTTTYTKGESPGLLTDTNQLIRAENALKMLPQYAGKKIMLYSTVYFTNDGGIHTMLQNPQNPKYIDNYDYDKGVWSAPSPQQLSIKDEIQSRMIALDKFSFKNAARVAGIFNEKSSHIEGAKPLTNLYIIIRNNEIQWLPTNIDGSRERYTIQFNTDGTLATFKQD